MDSPIVRATWQAGILSAVSNILAQLITCWRANASLHINVVDIFHFVLFSVLACPPNYIWQSWLEAKYPAYGEQLTSQEKEAMVDESVVGVKTAEPSKKIQSERIGKDKATVEKAKASPGDRPAHLSKKNTAIKFTLDQTIGAAVNTLLFVAGMGLIRGQSWRAIQGDIYVQFWPMIFAGQKLWPAVSVLCFTLVPLEYRMLVGNIAGLFWGIYLSLVSGSDH